MTLDRISGQSWLGSVSFGRNRNAAYSPRCRECSAALRWKPVRGELVLIRRLVFGTGHDSVVANDKV
jgi:hypothetical protein